MKNISKSAFLAPVVFLFAAIMYFILLSYNTKIEINDEGPMLLKNETQTRILKPGEKPNLVVITTGGTIAASSQVGIVGITPTLTGEQLITQVPELKKYAAIKVHEYSNIDSKDMEPADWINISKIANKYLNQPDVDGVIVLHGTDTMEQTAIFLEYTIQSSKPCLLTGAMLPNTDPSPDGPRNLLAAVRVASDPKLPSNLVGVVFNNRVISGLAVKKMHSTNLDAFEGGSRGYLANIDDENITWLNVPIKHKKFNLVDALPRVDIINVYPGVDDAFLKAALSQDTKGIVIVGYGSGNTNTAVAKGLDAFFAKKIPVIIDSNAPYGSSLATYGGVGGGAYFKEKGAILGYFMSPSKTRILLMLALANGIELNNLKTYLDVIE